MPFTLKCDQCRTVTSVLRDRPAIHVWCKICAHGRESVVDEERSDRCVVLTTDAMITAVSSLILCGLTGMCQFQTFRILVFHDLFTESSATVFWASVENAECAEIHI